MGNRQAATAFFNQGVNAHNTGDQDPRIRSHVYQLFNSACMADPTFWQPLYIAGNNASDMKLYYTAIAQWRRALECDDVPPLEKAKILSNLGHRLHTVGYTQEALAATNASLQLDPTLTNSWMNLSMIYTLTCDTQKAVECGRQALALERTPQTEFNMAFALIFNRELEEGLKFFEARFPYRLKEYLQYPYPKWDGEPDKIVFLAADQGMGDTLSFARFVPELCRRSKYVHARIQAPLVRLFMHAFAGIPNLNLIPSAYPFPSADAWTTFVSLPTNLKLDAKTIRETPAVTGGRWTVPNTWKVPDRKLHVGIAWAGSPLNDIDIHRNLPLHLFFEFYRVKGVQLYSLQVGERAQDLHNLGGGGIVRDVTPYITDITDTLAILQELDLVITVESALGHICAVANKECWIPYSYLGRDYRIGVDGTDMLWTPKHRVFRQKQDLDWRPVFAEIVQALEEKVR